MLTEKQKTFVELEKQKDEYKLFFDKLKQATQEVADEIGIEGMFQDDEGTVYQITIPEGRFVHYEKLTYIRTRRGEEKRGDLSLKKAMEAGFNVKE